MKGKKRMNKSALAVSLALFLVMFLLAGTFIFSQIHLNQDGIVLPNSQTDTEVVPTPEHLIKDTMLQITPDNVVNVLETLKMPPYYHQLFEVNVGTHHPQAFGSVEIWESDGVLHAECSSTESDTVKSVLTDGKTAWIWYDTDFHPVSVELLSISVEDLLGLPNFDYLTHLKQAKIETASYEVNEKTTSQSVYVSTRQQEGISEEYWVDLHTGLLQAVQISEGKKVSYVLRTVAAELLVQEDKSFEGRLCLPDGSNPFMAAK